MQPITVIFTLAEDDLDQVLLQMRHGNKMSVDAWNRDRNSTKLATGKLTTVDNQIDTTTGTVKLRAQFPEYRRRAVSQSVCEYPSPRAHAARTRS